MGILKSSSDMKNKHVPMCLEMEDAFNLRKLPTTNNFFKYMQTIFVPYFTTKLQKAFHPYLVRVCFYTDPMKGTAKPMFQKVEKRGLVGWVSLLSNWAPVLERMPIRQSYTTSSLCHPWLSIMKIIVGPHR